MTKFGAALLIFFAVQTAQAGTVRFNELVTPNSMNSLISKVAALYAAGDRNITVELNSDGGNLGSALNAAAKMKSYRVNTFVKGYCESSCTVLFAAGRTRTASNGADFMFHAVSVEHIARSLRKAGVTTSGTAQKYANAWLAAVRAASPSLAAKLERDHTLISGDETHFSGRSLRATGYVND